MWKMRAVPLYERKKRGCAYCLDVVLKKNGIAFRTHCPHKECPYHVFDKYDTYEEFMASEDAKILVDGFFQTAANCYELVNGNATVKQIYGSERSKRFL